MVKRFLDFKDLQCSIFLKRALEVAAAGGHHVLIFGPPGSGKTAAAFTFFSILPDVSVIEPSVVSRIPNGNGISIDRDRIPEGLLLPVLKYSNSGKNISDSGKTNCQGDVLPAHRGIWFYDIPNYNGCPADPQMIMTIPACPCGRLGSKDYVCFCTVLEIRKHWEKYFGPFSNKLDIRIPARSFTKEKQMNGKGEPSSVIRRRVQKALEIQKVRYAACSFKKNACIPVSSLLKYVNLSLNGQSSFMKACEKLRLSTLACHAVLRVARTIADLEGKEKTEKEHVYEAVQHRRYGDGDYYWKR